MSERRAKALRRAIYGDQSLRQPRTYRRDGVWTSASGHRYGTGAIRVLGLRADYQQAKKAA